MDIEGGFRRKLGTACKNCKKRKENRRGVVCIVHGIEEHNFKADTGIGQREQTPSQLSAPKHARPRGQRVSKSRPARSSLGVDDQISPSTRSSLPGHEPLATFYERAIGTRNWEVFCETLPIRIVYIGNSTANLHQLVHTEDPGTPLHYPFPSIKSLLPWRPDPEQLTGTYLNKQVTQDLSCLPTKAVRDSLVQTYFDDIHPGFPVIDEEEFRRQYEDEESPPPLLLFHAVLLAAARVSDHPMVTNARPNVTATLFRRAKTLFEMRYENDRVFLVQAALLLAWHVENSDTISCNSYHWIGQAARIAMGLGMHRDLLNSPSSIMPIADRRVYRKCWWAIMQAETFTALEYGRPSMIREDDYDQPPLRESDFLNFDGSADTKVQQSFFMLNASLSEMAIQVLAINAPRSRVFDTSSIDDSLAAWTVNLPSSHDFWSCLLRINFSLIKLVLHRSGRNDSSPMICAEAASTILTTFETMNANGTIRRCPFYASTAFLGAAIQFSCEVKEAVACRASMKALSAHAQLERLLRPIEYLSSYWPNIETLHKLCVSLHKKCSDLIDTMHNQPSLLPEDFNVHAHIDWAEIMAGYQLPQTSQTFDITDWMNTL